MAAEIIIGADFVPTGSNVSCFSDGNADQLFGEKLKKLLGSTDLAVFNLEAPLTDRADPIEKCGPCLSIPVSAAKGLCVNRNTLFTLANNHIMDQSVSGLTSTIDTLQKHNLQYVGAGDSVDEAAKAYIQDINGIRVGFYCCCETEFSAASKSAPGANPFDPLDSPDHISTLKEQADFVVVLYHGGKEHYRYPSPYLQKTCRKLVDKGADIVVCQHSHCIGCMETWEKGTIVYGQGNFLFDYCNHECWQDGLLLRVTIEGNCYDVSYIPVVKNGAFVRLAEGGKKDEILYAFLGRSAEIRVPGFVEEAYGRFADSYVSDYFSAMHGNRYRSILFRILARIFGRRFITADQKRIYRKPQVLRMMNFIRCEAHRDLMCVGFERWLRK